MTDKVRVSRKSITVRSAKAKGRRVQQYIRDKLLELFPQLTTADVRSTPMGVPGEDIQLSQAARDLLQVQFECKGTAKSAIYTPYEQAKGHGTREPIVVIKADYKETLAVVRADWLLEILKEARSKKS